MQKITPVLWFNMNAEEAAAFYTSLLPDSRIDQLVRAPADNPSGEEGSAIVVDFTLAGQKYGSASASARRPPAPRPIR
ncbi:MAG: VOC family protein [Sphingomonas sp.]